MVVSNSESGVHYAAQQPLRSSLEPASLVSSLATQHQQCDLKTGCGIEDGISRALGEGGEMGEEEREWGEEVVGSGEDDLNEWGEFGDLS